MNTPTFQFRKSKVIFFIALTVSITGKAFGQSDTLFQAAGPDTVFTNRHVVINNTLNVYGKITADSMRIRGPLQIGDSTFSFHDNFTILNVKSDHIRSTRGRIALFGDDGVGGYNTNINLGIGVHNPTGKVDLNYDGTGNLKIGIGNRALSGGNSGGNLHIESTNILALNQYSNGNISMVNGANGGNVGIGEKTFALRN
ncbi:MAG: hypothetical protein K8R85_07415 [Bacteroidetes bacterium]|nr:hypothetical protein [Bacteroidota bacterium]